MTSQPGLKIVANISQSKDNQSIKFGQLIECKRDVFFFKNCVENEAGRLVAEFILFLKKINMRWKQAVCSLVSIYFNSPQLAML